MKRFRNLSEKQSDVFEQICINNDAGHNKRTLKALENKGLIECKMLPVNDGGFPPINILRSRVPVAIHMEWCQWCSDNFIFDDNGNPIEKESVICTHTKSFLK